MTLIKTQHNRRSFLKASALAGGGMLLGFNWLVSCAPADSSTAAAVKALEVPDSWFDVNAFIKIGENGVVTIMSPNPEIGQNIKTSMPMIVAEELDVDWNNVMVEQAGLDSDNYTRQVAGGSQSIRKGWESLRMAGATARQMLLLAAAKEWEVAVEELTTENGFVKHAATAKSVSYGEIASAAAAIEVPAEVALKETSDFNIIGVSKKNVDGPSLVKGEPLFGLDYQREGMLIAMIEHAPAFGMELKSLDDSAAKAMPGIVDVFKISTDSALNKMANTFAFRDMVAVVGKTTWEVMKAKKALKIEWEQATAAENSAEHSSRLADALDKSSSSSSKAERIDGDPQTAFSKASKVIERDFSAPFLAHNTMEPMNFFAHVTADKAELVGPTQTPAWMRQDASKLLGLKEEQIDILMTRMGGGFGRRLYGNFGLEAAMISQKLKQPVKLIYSREDDMTNGVYRPAYKVRYKAGLNDANELISFYVEGAGIHGGPVFANRFPAGAVENYASGNQEVASNVSTGAWRAPRSNFIAGAEQSFLDEVAEAAGKDPIEFRLELFKRAEENAVGKENDYDAARYAGVLKLVREKSGWGKETEGVHRGVAAYYCHNSYVAQVVDIVMENGKPRVQKVCCAVDCGIVVNPDAARNQIEGGIIDGIGHAMYSGLTFTDGVSDQKNFHQYDLIRHNQAPREIETFFVDNGIDPTGLGEPSLPPIMGALANALYKATGKRFYDQPFIKGVAPLA